MSYDDGYSAGFAAGQAGQMGECFTDPTYDEGYQAGYQAGQTQANAYNGPSAGPLTAQEAEDGQKAYEDYQEQARELYHMMGETPPEEIEHMSRGGNNPVPEFEPAE